MEKQFFDEKIIKGKLASGLNYLIFPKEMYTQKMAMITVGYGSASRRFTKDGTVVDTPEGIAHFLEHKLFDNPSGNAFGDFTRLGVYANAFTAFNNTSYYFTCYEHFEEGLETLLNFVSTPFFTDETVQKERGIIEQEIKMYDDNPAWGLYFGMLAGLYDDDRFKSIAGTEQSIGEITSQGLYQCYDSFYIPENMALICAGNIDIDKTLAAAEKYIKAKGTPPTVLFGPENENAAIPLMQREMAVSNPLFQLGMKDTVFEGQIARSCTAKVALDLLVGESSSLRQKWLAEGITDEQLSFDYAFGQGYGYASIMGQGVEGKRIMADCISAVDIIKKQGLSIKDFERIKNKQVGAFIRGFNSIEAIVMASAELALWNGDLFDCYKQYLEMKPEDCSQLLAELFDDKKIALSSVMPVKN